MPVRQRIAAITVVVLACAGCASVSVREDGSTAYLGCGRFETRPVESAGAYRGEYLDVRVAGLLILATPFSKSLALGLSRERSVLLGGDSSLTLEGALPLQSMTREMDR
jgi:hypothetical protein